MASASGYNHQRFARAVLKKSRKWEASLIVQLYPSHWRFEGSVSLESSTRATHFVYIARADCLSILPPNDFLLHSVSRRRDDRTCNACHSPFTTAFLHRPIFNPSTLNLTLLHPSYPLIMAYLLALPAPAKSLSPSPSNTPAQCVPSSSLSAPKSSQHPSSHSYTTSDLPYPS